MPHHRGSQSGMADHSQSALQGKVALITGAGEPASLHLARAVSDAGAALMLAGEEVSDLRRMTGESCVRGRQLLFHSLDLLGYADWQKVLAATLDSFGGIDLLVNCISLDSRKAATGEAMGYRDIQQVMHGVSLGLDHAVLAMRPDGTDGRGGTVINVLTLQDSPDDGQADDQRLPGSVVHQMSKQAAAEYRRQGYEIRVHCVIHDGRQQGLHDDVAQAVLYLASDAARWLTGAELVFESSLTVT